MEGRGKERQEKLEVSIDRIVMVVIMERRRVHGNNEERKKREMCMKSDGRKWIYEGKGSEEVDKRGRAR